MSQWVPGRIYGIRVAYGVWNPVIQQVFDRVLRKWILILGTKSIKWFVLRKQHRGTQSQSVPKSKPSSVLMPDSHWSPVWKVPCLPHSPTNYKDLSLRGPYLSQWARETPTLHSVSKSHIPCVSFTGIWETLSELWSRMKENMTPTPKVSGPMCGANELSLWIQNRASELTHWSLHQGHRGTLEVQGEEMRRAEWETWDVRAVKHFHLFSLFIRNQNQVVLRFLPDLGIIPIGDAVRVPGFKLGRACARKLCNELYYLFDPARSRFLWRFKSHWKFTML